MHKNWKTYKLSKVTTKIGSGSTPRGGKGAYKESGISLIRSQNVLDFKFSVNGLAFIDDEQAAKLKNVTIEENDVLLNITGDSVARVCSVPQEFLPARVNQHVAIIRADNKLLDSKFLMYSLLEKSNKDMLLTLGSAGATRNALTKSMIEVFELQLPPLKEQTQIANILSAIDDKIENNLATNKTLEDMAMALYKHWFVDFGPFQDGEFIDSELGLIPKGWEVKRLEELSEIGSSKRIFRKEYVDAGVPFYRGKEVIQLSKGKNISTELFITEERFQEIKLKFGAPVKGDILISSVGTIGVSWLVDDSGEFYFKDGNLTWLKNYKSFIKGEFLHLWLNSNVGQEQILGETIGSTQQALTISALRSLKLVIPPKSIYQKLEENLVNSYRQTQLNLSEVATLTNLRDTLLPKLISGEIRLKEFKTQVEHLV
ncbi:restriction endonuclease subunit S [Olleya namhaensis]|uniref:restriction endonuclease subunit S n=1 Tax=Olleya namhaensis TaxID=1144750 RepID=UPI002492AC96|nr:restriction endonuclease subunit S [Olleya namhaensis]